jgi:excisionase family DNA binding protein
MAMDKLLGLQELSDYLGIKKSTLYIWCCHKKIGYYKVGRLVKFRLDEVEAWLQQKRVETMQ